MAEGPTEFFWVVFLRLDVDTVQSKGVLVYDAIDPAITTPTDCPTCVLCRPPIPHCQNEIDHELLEKLGGSLCYPLQQFLTKRYVNVLESFSNNFIGRSELNAFS